MPDLSLYEGREQSWVKHYILEHYLERLAHIIGYSWPSIAYVDCFSGPWESRSPELIDTSFAIAIDAFRKAKADLAKVGKHPDINCLFLEKEREPFRRLNEYVQAVSDVHAEALNRTLEAAVEQILDFVHMAGPRAFSFMFLDPTGWTGFSLDLITPLLQLMPGEVLINFMTHHIRRFIDVDESADSFIRLFGKDIRKELESLDRQEREERLVGLYMRQVKKRGTFSYVGSAVVFKPDVETTHFHLIYATRHDRGIEEFKKVEEHAMPAAEQARISAKERKRQKGSGQMLLVDPADHHRSRYLDNLRRRYLARARSRVEALLQKEGEVEYRRVWRRAVALPLVWERDVLSWIEEWRSRDMIDVPGISSRQRPTRTRNDVLRWRG